MKVRVSFQNFFWSQGWWLNLEIIPVIIVLDHGSTKFHFPLFQIIVDVLLRCPAHRHIIEPECNIVVEKTSIDLVDQILADNGIERQSGSFDRPRIVGIALHIFKMIVFNNIATINGLLDVRPATYINTITAPGFCDVIVRNGCHQGIVGDDVDATAIVKFVVRDGRFPDDLFSISRIGSTYHRNPSIINGFKTVPKDLGLITTLLY